MTKLAFVFPGQGSQSLGMLSQQAALYPVISETFAEASDALGFDLWALSQQGPEEKLNQTEFTQPALLAAGIALWRCWCQLDGPGPDYLAGHSLGEYAALVAANALSLPDGIRLVSARGRYMQEAVPQGTGAMAAILGLEDEQVVNACEQAAAGGIVSAANFNAPGQVVIAGEKAAVLAAVEIAKNMGAKKAVELAVSVPSHCQLMQVAGDRLAEDFAGIKWRMPEIPVMHNATASFAGSLDEMTQALVDQISRPVRWAESLLNLQNMGVATIVECGPGKVLSGLNRRISRDLQSCALETSDLPQTIDTLKGAS